MVIDIATSHREGDIGDSMLVQASVGLELCSNAAKAAPLVLEEYQLAAIEVEANEFSCASADWRVMARDMPADEIGFLDAFNAANIRTIHGNS